MKIPFSTATFLMANGAALCCATSLNAAGTANAACKRAVDKRPNIILFLIDDLGWPDVGCFGSSFYETPNIDRMAREGVKFTSAYTTCHVSSPSRASILTGRYPASINMTDWLPGRRDFPFQELSNVEVNQDLPAEEVTIAETLYDNGYHTAMIGKWHLGETGSAPTDHGFEQHIPQGYLKGWPARGYYAPFGMNGFDGREGEYLTDRLTDEAVNYIQARDDKPFFLFMSHYAVHDPIQGRADLVEKYKQKLLSMPRTDIPAYILEGNPDDKNPLTREMLDSLIDNPIYASHKVLPHNLVKIKQIQDNIQFAAMVESMDESLGRIMESLEKEGIADNTVVIFFADNGGMSAANYGGPNRVIDPSQLNIAYSSSMLPLRGGKGWLYEGGVRVPMVVKYPHHARAGRVCDVPVISVDLYPTILSLAGIDLPPQSKSEGEDISSLLRRDKAEERPIFWHFPHYSNHGMQSPSGAVRMGDYKLIEYYQNGTVQLFDIRHDMAEQHDLSAVMPEKCNYLKGVFHEWLQDVGARMPYENAAYNSRIEAKRLAEVRPDRWWTMFAQSDGGEFGRRLQLWREGRLEYVAHADFLLEGFESRPGMHPWQGEHVGKWLHAAALAYNHTGDAKLKRELDSVACALMATQLNDGYMGTYAPGQTFMARPDDATGQMWDVWTHRYNIYGLLTYDSFFHSDAAVEACCRMADLLIATFDGVGADITANGTRSGISSSTLLESIVMLYERTGEQRYLDFAQHIVAAIEANPRLHLMGEMLNGDKDLTRPGDGKAYQLLSNLLGYLRLYQVTGQEEYLRTVQAAWGQVRKNHLLSTGGVWSRQTSYNGNRECFAHVDAFNPEELVVENCSNVTWIQLCLGLFDMTGMAKYLDEAELTLLNDLYGHQSLNGIDGCYYTRPNQSRLPYVEKIHCCNSSAPRAMELMADHIAGEIDNCLSIDFLTPSRIKLNPKFGGGEAVVSGNYPMEPKVKIELMLNREPYRYGTYSIEVRIPLGTELKRALLNGKEVEMAQNKRGFYYIQRQWRKSDSLEIELDYRLRAVVQEGEGGKRWVAFTYGPLALAQKITQPDSFEPFAQTSFDVIECLSRFELSREGGVPVFTVAGTELKLQPYSTTGSDCSGPKSYFRIK